MRRNNFRDRLGERTAETLVKIEQRSNQPVPEVRVLHCPSDEPVHVGAMLRDEGLIELDLFA